VKLVHLVGFIKKKFVTMYGHMNVKKKLNSEVHCCGEILVVQNGAVINNAI